MPNTNENTHNQNSDEIDLVDLIGALWDGRWIIIGVTALVTILGGIYAITQPRTTTANLAVSVSNDARSALNMINVELEKNQLVKIDNTIVSSFAKSHLSEVDWPEGIPAPAIESSENKENLTLVFQSQSDFSFDSDWLNSEQTALNMSVSTGIEDELASRLEAGQLISKQQIDELVRQRAALVSQKEIESRARLAFLENQLEIARALGQRKSIFMSEDGKIPSSTSSANLPYYHFGSIVIETEIQQLKRASSYASSDIDLNNLDLKIQAFENGANLKLLRNNVNEFVSKSGQMPVFDLQTSGVVFSKTSFSSRIVLFAFLAGGFLSLMVLVVWRSLQTYWKRQSTTKA